MGELLHTTHGPGSGDDEELARTLRRYRAMLDSVSDIVLCLDADGILTYLSESARTLLGYDVEEWLGRAAFDLVHPDDLALVLENFEATIDHTADESPMTVRVLTATGEWISFEVFANNRLDDPDVAAVVVSIRDVTERMRQETALEESQEALRLAERQFRSSFDHAPIGMALVGIDGSFVRVNRALCDIVGYEPADLLARTFQQITVPEDLEADLQLLHELLLGERVDYQLDKRYLRPDGSTVWAQLNVTMVRSGQGNPVHFVAQIQDVTERRSMHEALIEQANRDALTGLANRGCFEQRLAEACAVAPDEEPVTVIFMDLNEFKVINDTYGHRTGDLVLQRVAERLERALRPGDVAGRIGGDELAAILVGADAAVADQVTLRLRRAIAEPMEVDGRWLTLTASIGHVSARSVDDAHGLLVEADRAMYEDKRSQLAG